jgi:16S rRNA (guanine527-N7)-methyltransferase
MGARRSSGSSAAAFPVKRLEALCLGWDLPSSAKPRLERLLRFLANAPDAPTTITDPDRALDVHVADSLSALSLLRGRSRLERLVDVGSGAGLPGLPLAVAMPSVRFDLVEATQRKCVFIGRAVGEVELRNVTFVCARAEAWGAEGGREAYDAVTIRALGPLPTLVEYAAPLLRVGGLLIAWKGRRDFADERAGAAAAALLGLGLPGVTALEPTAEARWRHLHSYEKLRPTPPGYPRRPGVARKRPLMPKPRGRN